ncbi:MAG: PelD GGDEF domain-containing protein [Ramlibacter sp.]
MSPPPDRPPAAEPAAGPGPADSTPAALDALRVQRRAQRFDPARDSIYSDFTASVQDMLDALRDPGVQAPRTPLQRWLRPLLVAWVVADRSAGLLRLYLRRWIRHHPGLLGRVLETLLWPALFVYLAFISNPGNPFYIDEGFPWPWLGPWLIALRYGVGYGAAASAGLLGAWYWLSFTPQFPRLYFLGGAIAMLIAGEFGSYWRLRVLRLQESLRFLNDKAERLTRRLYLIKLSHDELEYEMVDRPATLRESLIDLRVMMDQYTRNNPGDLSGLPGAQLMLDFVVNHCRIETAALYEVRLEPALQLIRVAAVGRMIDPPADDPMILRAVETGHQVHLQDALLEKARRSSLVAATPLLSTERQAFGLLAIGNMPFTALTTDNLQTVAVLLESYADYLRLSVSAGELLGLWPDAPRGLAGEFGWLTRLRTEYGLESRCVVWRAEHPRAAEVLAEILALHSRGETAWRWPVDATRNRGAPCVIALTPFTDASGVRVYKQRILDGVAQQFGEIGPQQLSAFDFALGRDQGFARLRWLVESGE